MKKAAHISLALILVGLAFAASYAFALAGEPQSHWLWCVQGGLCD